MIFIRPFNTVGMADISLVGGKNASLGEMIQHLEKKGLRVPPGFAITSDAYRYLLESNKLTPELEKLLGKIHKDDLKGFAAIGRQVRSLIRQATFPPELIMQIKKAYAEMSDKHDGMCTVAVRSSATAEDLPTASFAGQQETFLNIEGIDALLNACKESYASLFTDRAISYRIDHNFNHFDVALSIGVQKMVRSDKASSGVIFTLDTESGFPDVVFISSSWGLGEGVVKGMVSPDEFYVFKNTLTQGFRPLLKKRMGEKTLKVVYGKAGGIQTLKTTQDEYTTFSLTDDEILELSKTALIIEDYYTQKAGKWCPMDIEWAKDGDDGKLYIVQARPETVYSHIKNEATIEEHQIDKKVLKKAVVVVQGKSVGKKVSHGKARVIDSVADMNELLPGEILVTDMTDPDWEPVMKKAAGIVTNRGGRTCHAAIVSRELGIPAIVGAIGATERIKTGQEITLDCSHGEIGSVYNEALPFTINAIPLKKIPHLSVHLMLNVGNPDEAFRKALLPNDGVGLARLEFIINSAIKVHPMALIRPDKVTDQAVLKEIDRITLGYEDKKQFYIDKLAQEAGTIIAAFYPKPVIVRFSDFKSNEYKELVGGRFFEPTEENPMIGFRGASRYYHENFEEAFILECLAMKKIRYEMGLDNLKLMIPFVRTPQEALKVTSIIEKQGIKRGEDGIEIYMMVEIPSNCLLMDEFSPHFDGFSIGSNDLTQLVLAVDRDSALVAPLFDERNEAVKKMLIMAIEGAHRNKKPIGICGQAPSDFPEIAQFLLEHKIDSISLNPDTIVSTMMQLGGKKGK